MSLLFILSHLSAARMRVSQHMLHRVAVGDELVAHQEKSGWVWCTNHQGKSGWVPLDHIT